MQECKSLFDEAFQTLQEQRAKHLASPLHPLAQEARARLEERLADITLAFPTRREWDRKERPAGQRGCDLITSVLALQKANDLQGELEAIRTALADGGLFLGVLLGGNSLHELRTALMDAEIALTGGTAPRVAPMVDGETMSRLLSLAGFALPVVDVERVTLEYPDLQSLMHDLRAFGCANALSERSHRFAPRVFFNKAQDVYAARFATPSGGIAVTIDLIFLHGWREGN